MTPEEKEFDAIRTKARILKRQGKQDEAHALLKEYAERTKDAK